MPVEAVAVDEQLIVAGQGDEKAEEARRSRGAVNAGRAGPTPRQSDTVQVHDRETPVALLTSTQNPMPVGTWQGFVVRIEFPDH
jgi:hypothetical protein